MRKEIHLATVEKLLNAVINVIYVDRFLGCWQCLEVTSVLDFRVVPCLFVLKA